MKFKSNRFRIISFICVISLLACLTGCSGGKSAVELEKASVSKGVFAYYLDSVLTKPKSYGLSAAPSEKEAVKAAVRLCEEHIGINSICRERGYTLSYPDKSSVASDTENYWGMFSDYYKDIGMEKQDLTFIKENQAKRAMLTEKLFGADGEKPVKKSEIIKSLNSNYAGFKAITGYFTKIDETGSEVSCTDAEKDEIRASFKEMAKKINDGDSIETLNKSYNESQGLSGADKLSVIVIDSSDSTYSGGFYEQVKKIKTGKAGVVEVGEYIYVILRVDISSDKYIKTYSKDILEKLRHDDVSKVISEWTEKYGKTKVHSLSGIYSQVASKHQNKGV